MGDSAVRFGGSARAGEGPGGVDGAERAMGRGPRPGGRVGVGLVSVAEAAWHTLRTEPCRVCRRMAPIVAVAVVVVARDQIWGVVVRLWAG